MLAQCEGWRLLLTLLYQVYSRVTMSGNLGLYKVVASGSGGAEVASAGVFAEPNQVGSFWRGPAKICVPAKPLLRNP